jgi:hypothetical protein
MSGGMAWLAESPGPLSGPHALAPPYGGRQGEFGTGSRPVGTGSRPVDRGGLHVFQTLPTLLLTGP